MGLLSWLTGKKAADAASPAAPDDEPVRANEGEEGEGTDPEPGVPAAELARWLASPDGGQRIDGARGLLERWRSGDPEAAAALFQDLPALLADGEAQLRGIALAASRLVQKPENQERLSAAILPLLADDSAQVRAAAVWAAVQLPGETAREQVRALLGSREEPLRFAAACALADKGDPAAVDELCRALAQELRRQEALSALLALGDRSALPAVAAILEDERAGLFDRTLAAAVLVRLEDPRGASHLLERLADACDDRPVAAEWAGRLRVAEAIPALEELAEAEGDPARGAALRALGRLGAPGAEARLLALAGDASQPEDLRMDAAEGLAELGSPEARARLEALAGEARGELGPLCAELAAELSSELRALERAAADAPR
jgi:HEAT repeat protein